MLKEDSQLPPLLVRGCLTILFLALVVVLIDQYLRGWVWYPPDTVFEAAGTLVAALAFWGVVATVSLQSRELALQRQELADTRKELQRQAKAQEKSEQALSEQVSALHRQADALTAQTAAISRPYISVRIRVQQDTLLILEIQNTGKSPALNLTMTLDKEFHIMGVTESERIPGIHRAFSFHNTIPAFSNGMKLLFPLATGDKLKGSSPDDPLIPLVFTLTATYAYAGQQYSEVHSIDLRMFNNSFVEQNFELDRLTAISKSLESIAKSTERMSKEPRSLS
ncbi:MAG: hypothetical protein D8M52_04405 [Chlorobi bacterium]|nr:MAG: DUF2968 domain-containing protein [Bacteroidota bacterium]KXK34643.1 MAG: hypothetical protein UZ06_CHB003001106 [Chlorobi bacterium OLB6]MBL1160945.1 hypothetical protein [Chlorobiota bacterium]MBW7852904.1 hypothetical protein [Candidatus Kapabacteria bacterium]MCL4276583.1 hypothetical protein [Ignavibacteria bacterium]